MQIAPQMTNHFPATAQNLEQIFTDVGCQHVVKTTNRKCAYTQQVRGLRVEFLI